MAKKILLIEDDEFLRKVISRKLSEESYVLVKASRGEEGIRIMKEEKPDLVLLDLILPEMNGFDLLARIKQDPVLAKIPVIVLSNLGGEEDVKRALKMGAADYLIKAHFTLGEVIKRVEAVLGKKKGEKRI